MKKFTERKSDQRYLNPKLTQKYVVNQMMKSKQSATGAMGAAGSLSNGMTSSLKNGAENDRLVFVRKNEQHNLGS